MKRINRRILSGILLCLSALLTGCAAASAGGEEPVKVTFWHYYNDAQKEGLEEIVAEYNETVGKEKNVTVETLALGSIEDIVTKVEAGLAGEEGERPNMFLAYRDTLQEIRRAAPEALLDFHAYYTDEELDRYYEDYLEEGEFDGALYIMPVAKATELLFMNQEELDRFLAENQAYSVEDLASWESMSDMAEAYYEWTDGRTPDVPHDGKALMGMDNFSNYFIAQNHALGSSIYETAQDGGVRFTLEEDVIKRLFLNYYVPYTKGYYGGTEKYCSDDLRQGNLCGYIGSTTSVAYFPAAISAPDGSEIETEMEVYPYPVFTDADPAAIQQGAGIAALETGEMEDQAVADFIQWIEEEKGIEYASMLSYMPTSKETVAAQDYSAITDENVRKAVETGMEQVRDYRMVRGFDFEGSYGLRMELEDYFQECLQSGREEYEGYLDTGMTPEEADGAMGYEEKASGFYERITKIFS